MGGSEKYEIRGNTDTGLQIFHKDSRLADEEPPIQWWVSESCTSPGVWCTVEFHADEAEHFVYAAPGVCFPTGD